MTNAELLAKIKAEIERLMDEYTDIAIDSHYGTVNANHIVADLGQLVSFLSTLESEKPSEGLEEEIGSYMSNKWKFGCITPITPVVLPYFTTEDLKECARHFAQWGAEHSGSSEIPNDQPLPEDTVLFNKGVEEGKRLMMEEAVEGFIFQSTDYYPKQLIAGYDGELGMGDKVKIIIVKED